jgi:hypothetical protein
VPDATDCRLTERMSQLHRLIAAEHIARLPNATMLFVTNRLVARLAARVSSRLPRSPAAESRAEILIRRSSIFHTSAIFARDFVTWHWRRVRRFAASTSDCASGIRPDYLKLARARRR